MTMKSKTTSQQAMIACIVGAKRLLQISTHNIIALSWRAGQKPEVPGEWGSKALKTTKNTCSESPGQKPYGLGLVGNQHVANHIVGPRNLREQLFTGRLFVYKLCLRLCLPSLKIMMTQVMTQGPQNRATERTALFTAQNKFNVLGPPK